MNHPPAHERRSLLRGHGGGHAPVSYLELFFDLVYVFAITQVSHFLLHNLTPVGLVQGLMIFAAVWWAWVFTTWSANWADPDRLPVRIMLLAVMFGSLVMSIAIPRAFTDQAAVFVTAYLAMQLGRTLFMAWAMRGSREGSALNMVRIAVWFCISGLFWVAGARDGDVHARMAWWLVALGIEYAGPAMRFRVPGLGGSGPEEWNISGAHMAERCALFIIIALGEGIVVTGATVAETEPTRELALAFLAAFTGSALMWWLYFDFGAQRGAEHISGHATAGMIARNAYTYLHIPIVFGIVASAVGDELLLAHPSQPVGPASIAAAAGSLAIYLLGLGAFKRHSNTHRNFPLSHLVGLALLALIAAWGWWAHPSALVFAAVLVALLALLAAWEWGSFHGGWQERIERGLGYVRRPPP